MNVHCGMGKCHIRISKLCKIWGVGCLYQLHLRTNYGVHSGGCALEDVTAPVFAGYPYRKGVGVFHFFFKVLTDNYGERIGGGHPN